jgi:ADP-ribose pyrophosphatase
LKERTISSRRIYEGQVVNLRIDTIEKSAGETTTREIVEHADCVAVVPLDNDDNVILVRQYRKAVEKSMLEIPAGGIDPGEKPEDAVRRDLQEEIGYIPGKVELLGGFYSSPGFCTEYLHFYLATQLEPGRLIAEDTDEIEVEKVHLSKIPSLILSGEICDLKSIAGLLWVIYPRLTRH